MNKEVVAKTIDKELNKKSKVEEAAGILMKIKNYFLLLYNRYTIPTNNNNNI